MTLRQMIFSAMILIPLAMASPAEAQFSLTDTLQKCGQYLSEKINGSGDEIDPFKLEARLSDDQVITRRENISKRYSFIEFKSDPGAGTIMLWKLALKKVIINKFELDKNPTQESFENFFRALLDETVYGDAKLDDHALKDLFHYYSDFEAARLAENKEDRVDPWNNIASTALSVLIPTDALGLHPESDIHEVDIQPLRRYLVQVLIGIIDLETGEIVQRDLR